VHILVADDELSMREYLDLLLTRAGYTVTLASSEPEALSLLEARPVDLVVSDMRLGKGSGMSVLRAARSLPHPPEVILITAFGTPASAVEAMRAGAYDYICKPFDNEELLLLVQRALEKRGLREENRQLKQSLAQPAPWVGQSPRMHEVWALVERAAPARSSSRVPSTSAARAPRPPSCPSTARRWPRACSRASCSGT
jgi:two-component system, NtrC family, response regulator PilR